MPLPGWTRMIANRVEVALDKVVLDLLANDTALGRFTVYQSGRIEPEPPNEARDLLVRQAAALRGELVSGLQWVEGADGWKSLHHQGHSVMVRRASANKFEAVIDGIRRMLEIFPDDLKVAQGALEGLIVELAKRDA